MLRQGSVIQAWVSDPQGNNRKLRPLVVVTPTEEIEATSVLFAVAITSRITDPIHSDEVLLPFHPAGQTKTGLRKKCAAKCSWLVQLSPADIHDIQGFVPSKPLARILRILGESGNPDARD